MGPLVYYCRWQRLKLRLQGRDERFVWGRLIAQDAAGERAEPFHFDLGTWELFLEGEQPTRLQLDELGVVVPSADESTPTTSVDD